MIYTAKKQRLLAVCQNPHALFFVFYSSFLYQQGLPIKGRMLFSLMALIPHRTADTATAAGAFSPSLIAKHNENHSSDY